MTTHNNNNQLPILPFLIQFHILSYAWDQSIIESRDAWVWIRCKLPLVCKRYNQHINRVLLHQSLWFNDYNQFKGYLLRLKSNSSPCTSVNDGNDYSIILPRSLTIKSNKYDFIEEYCKEKTFDEWNTVFQECSDQLNMVLSSITSLKTDSSLMYYLISTLNKYNNALLNNNKNNNNSNKNNNDQNTELNNNNSIINQNNNNSSNLQLVEQMEMTYPTSTTTTSRHGPKPLVPRIKKSRPNNEDDLGPSWKNTLPLSLNSISIICFPYLEYYDDEDGFIKELGKIIRSGGTSI